MLHIDGFDQFDGESAVGPTLVRAEYVTAGGLTIVAGRGPGSKAISAQNGSLSRTQPWTGNTFAAGTAFSFTARGSLMWLKFGTEYLTLWLHPDTGLPMMNASVGGALPIKNTWYYYEIELDRGAGLATLSINNRVDSTFALTPGMLAAQDVQVGLGYRAPSTYWPGSTFQDISVKTYDDFYINGAARLGPIVITTRFPDTDVQAEWFKAGAVSTHAAAVSGKPPTPLDLYIASDTVGKRDKFKSARPLANSNPIVGTGLVVLARKSPSLSAQLGVFMGGDGTAPLRQATRAVDTNWRTQYICFDQTAGDSKANIEAAPFGVVISN